MKVLLINGSPTEHGCTYTALHEVEKTLNAEGIDTELRYIGKKPVAGCIACRTCAETGRCVFGDQVCEIQAELDSIDGIIVGSPVYFAGPSGQLCAFLDRLFYANSEKFAGKVGAAVVNCRRGGATAAFDRLNKYFTIRNMLVVGSQYWNQTHGLMPEDLLKDEEGLQTMRTLGQNFAWTLKSIEAGKAAHISAPVYETPTPTHFIR